jgi:hypothetical protein
VIVELVALGDRDLAGHDDHKASGDLADGPERFTGREQTRVAEPAHPLNFELIELGKNLVAPGFANGLRLQCHDPEPATVTDEFRPLYAKRRVT